MKRNGMLSNRLRTVIEEIIHEDQRGCIPGRNSSECIRMLEDLIENETDDNSCITRPRKTLNRVGFSRLIKTVEAFSFGKKSLLHGSKFYISMPTSNLKT